MRRPAILGLAAAAVLLLWQAVTVHYNFGGNWTALFMIAPHMPVPPFLKSENLYIFQNTGGYDGQVYHLMAHDPWMRRGSADAIAGAAYRYQRILVPALAWCLALGRDPWIHAAYFAVILGFVFLGVYWLAQIALRAGLAPAWGLAFVLAPATITSIDRMTADIALAALAVGFVLYSQSGPAWKTIAVLACAALTRETALVMIGGYALYLFSKKRFGSGMWVCAAVLPTFAWYAYLTLTRPAEPSTPPDFMGLIPFRGLALRLVHPISYSMTPFRNAAGLIFNYIALAGVVLVFVLAIRLAIRRRWDPQTAAMYALGLAIALLRDPRFFDDVYGYGRPLTPLLLLVAVQYFAEQPWLAIAPMVLIDARIGLNFVSQIAGIARGIAGI